MVNNSIENGTEDIETKNKSKKSEADLKQEFIKEFIFEGTKDKDKKTEFINSVFSDKNIINLDLEKQLKSLRQKDKFKNIDLREIKKIDLEDALLNEKINLVNKRNNFKNHVIKNYDITNNDYNNSILNSVKELSEKELDEYLNSEGKRIIFLEKELKREIKTQNFNSFLVDFEIKEEYKKLNDEQKVLLSDFYDEECELRSEVSETQILSLLKSGLFGPKKIKEILTKFSLIIDLNRAKELGFIDNSLIKGIKEKLIKDTFHDKLDYDRKEYLLDSIKDSSIEFNLSDYIVKESISKKLDDIINDHIDFLPLDSLVTSYNDTMKEVSKQQNKLNDFEGELRKYGELNFKNNNILTIKKFDSEGFVIGTSFYKILDLGIEDGKIKLLNKTLNGKYTENKNDDIVTCSHKDIIFYLENKKSPKQKIVNESDLANIDTSKSFELKCFSKESFKSELYNDENNEFTEHEDDLNLVSSYDIEKNYIKKKLIEEDKIPEYISDEDLQNEELEYKDLYDDYKKSLSLEDVEYQSALSINKDILKQKIDSLDIDGVNYGFSKGTTFETKNGDFFTIIEIDTGDMGEVTIIPVQGGPSESFNFDTFFSGWKINEAKRTSKLTKAESLFADIVGYSDIGTEWGKFEYKDAGIYNKNGDQDNNIEYDYLVSKTESGFEELLKIHSIDGDSVLISFGEIEEDKKEKKSTFKVGKKEHRVNIGFLDSWIKKYSLIPRSLDEEKDIKEDDIESVDIKGHFWSRFFDRLSVMDLFRGGKLYVESIENYIKEGQEENSAKLANALWLPEELKADLIAREESAKKKRMDGYVEKLKGIDSGPATIMIRKWLLNKNSSDPKKEAGLIFMMEKYGVLYAKGGLYPYKGKFLWYQALGGKVGDELYNDIKKQEEDKDQVFTEEQLIYILLVKQCKPEGYKGIRRRSRLHKEFKAFRAKGKEEEFDTGKQDGGDISKCDNIVNFALDEIMGGTYPNGAGGLEVVVERGGPVDVMNKVPFVLLFSGAAYSMEEKTRDLIRKMPEKGMILPIVSLIRYKSGIDIATNVILELSKRIADVKGGKYSSMGVDAEEIFNNMHSTKKTEKEKIEDTIEFYDNYGKVLMESLYGLNKPEEYKDDKDAYINNIIYIEKDDREDEEGGKIEGNIIFKKYYDTLQANADQYEYKEEFMNDAHKGAGMTGFDSYKTLTYALKVNSGGSYINSGSAPTLINEMDTEMNNIINDAFLSQDKNEKDRKKLIMKSLRGLIGAIVAVSSASLQRSKQLLPFFNKYGINLDKLEGLDKAEILKLNKGTKEYQFISKLADDIINTQTGNNVSSIGVSNHIDNIIGEYKEAA